MLQNLLGKQSYKNDWSVNFDSSCFQQNKLDTKCRYLCLIRFCVLFLAEKTFFYILALFFVYLHHKLT